MSDKNNRREFERFPVEFEIEVAAENKKDKRFKEKTTLIDITGGGAKFMTQQGDEYYPGQILDITVHLPGTDDVRACMKGEAEVVRIDSPDPSEQKVKSKGVRIAVKIDIPLHFERVDTKT